MLKNQNKVEADFRSNLKIDKKFEMDVILGDELFPFHGFVNLGEAGALKVVLALYSIRITNLHPVYQ